MQWIKQHFLIFLGVIVVLCAMVFYAMSSSAPPAPILTTSGTTGSPSADSSDQELVATLLALRAVTLSGTIFQDPAFISLSDFSTPIVPEPVGRPNPFAPLQSGTSTPDNSRTTQLFTPTR
jgi:hypothetical protein